MPAQKKDDATDDHRLFQEADRRRYDGALTNIFNRLDAGDQRMGRMEVALGENTESTKRIEASMSGVVAFSDDLASGSRLICRVAKGINFIANKKIWVPVLVCYLAIYFVTHDGQLPDWAYRLVSGLIGT